MHASLDDGALKFLSRTGVALANAGASQALGRGSTGSPDMDVRAVVVLNEAEFGGSLAAARSAAVVWLETLRWADGPVPNR